MKPCITIVNGSLGGSTGNSSALTEQLAKHLEPFAELPHLILAAKPDWARVKDLLSRSDGFVFTTGTYWDSWGSPLQEFFEKATEIEASDIWLGKPAAVLVTMHSVGGKEILSRLQGVLSTLGLLIPPMSGMAFSLATYLALQKDTRDFAADFWQPKDLEVIAHNLMQAIGRTNQWRSWEVDRADPMRLWCAGLEETTSSSAP